MWSKKSKMTRLSFTTFIVIAFICLTMLLQVGKAEAVTHVYYTDQDTGTTVATGVTTDWATCGNGTVVTTLALQDTSGSCDARMSINGGGVNYEVWYNTAFAVGTTITGQATGNLWYLDERSTGGNCTLSLLYVIPDGTITVLGSNSVNVPNNGSGDYDFDMSAVSGDAPSGSKFGFRLGCDATFRVNVGPTNNNAGNNDSGYVTIDETLACAANAPSDLSAPTVDWNQVILDWTSDCVNNNEYRVYRTPDFTVPGYKAVACPTTGTYTDSDVLASTAYSYTVRGYNTAGTCESSDSNQVDVNTPAYEIKTVVGTQSAISGDQLIDVEATYSSDDDGDLTLTVFWDTVSGGETNSCGSAIHPASPYQVQCTGLTNGLTYFIRVKYVDPDGFTVPAGTTYNWDSGAIVPRDPSFDLIHNSDNLTNAGWGSGWGVSGGQYGEFLCETCHIDPATETTTNIKRIKTPIETPNTDTWPAACGGGQTTGTISFLQADGINSDMGDTAATFNGICNMCHDPAKHSNYDCANSTTDA